MQQNYIIGIDGGGTKTVGRIESLSANETHTLSGGSASLSNNYQTALDTIKQLLIELTNTFDAKASDTTVVIGIAGGELPDLATKLAHDIGMDFKALKIVNDAVTSIYGVNDGDPAAMIALGTGSIGGRLNKDGSQHYVGGWGFPIGDEGSGAKLGYHAVQTLLSDYNWHNAPVSKLSRHLETLVGNTKPAIGTWLLNAQPYDYAAIAPCVFKLYDECGRAKQLIDEHVQACETLIKQTRSDSSLDVFLLGGLAQLTWPLLSEQTKSFCHLTNKTSLDGACYLARQRLQEKQTQNDSKENKDLLNQQERDELLQQLDNMSSETRHPDSLSIDRMPTLEILNLMNTADLQVVKAVEQCLPNIVTAVESIVQCFKNQGRLIYVGAGTSGRLGVLDAVECPPTFGVSDNQVIGLIAGGKNAIFKAVEGAEDSSEMGQNDLIDINLTRNDLVVGIAASGRTPYVLGALSYAKQVGCQTIGITSNSNTQLAKLCHIAICPTVGPEVLTGSTRLKSGTAQKMILNMLTTASMIKVGKVYQNLMVDVNASNKKLYVRAIRIVMQATGCDAATAQQALELTHYRAKSAILSVMTGKPVADIDYQLKRNNGFISDALVALNEKNNG